MKFNLKEVSKETWLRSGALLLALINQILIGAGFKPFPYEANEIYEIVSSLVTVIVSVIAWWKNNSFSEEAIQADKVIKGIREISE